MNNSIPQSVKTTFVQSNGYPVGNATAVDLSEAEEVFHGESDTLEISVSKMPDGSFLVCTSLSPDPVCGYTGQPDEIGSIVHFETSDDDVKLTQKLEGVSLVD